MKMLNPATFSFEGDDETPNNPTLPLLVYRDVVPVGEGYAADWFERTFAAHGWADGWRNGIHPFLHFHTGTHECWVSPQGTPLCGSEVRRAKCST